MDDPRCRRLRLRTEWMSSSRDRRVGPSRPGRRGSQQKRFTLMRTLQDVAQLEIVPPLDDAGPAPRPGHPPPYDLVVADASWPWTENLFAPLARFGVRILLIKACDWRNAWQQGRP